MDWRLPRKQGNVTYIVGMDGRRYILKAQSESFQEISKLAKEELQKGRLVKTTAHLGIANVPICHSLWVASSRIRRERHAVS